MSCSFTTHGLISVAVAFGLLIASIGTIVNGQTYDCYDAWEQSSDCGLCQFQSSNQMYAKCTDDSAYACVDVERDNVPKKCVYFFNPCPSTKLEYYDAYDCDLGGPPDSIGVCERYLEKSIAIYPNNPPPTCAPF